MAAAPCLFIFGSFYIILGHLAQSVPNNLRYSHGIRMCALEVKDSGLIVLGLLSQALNYQECWIKATVMLLKMLNLGDRKVGLMSSAWKNLFYVYLL